MISMNMRWNWLIGRRLSSGTVVSVSGEIATVRRGNGEFQIPLCELLHEDYKAQDRAAASMCEAMNTGDGAYRA